MIPELTSAEIARFHSKILRGDGCWLWQVETNNKGYGRFAIWRGERRIRILAHRLAWLLTTGIDPGAEVIRHDCDTPACCNPGHMRLGTQADNVRDAVERSRADLSGLRDHRSAKTARFHERLARDEKRCPGCGAIKSINDFHRNRSTRDGRQNYCIPCKQAMDARRRKLRRQQEAA